MNEKEKKKKSANETLQIIEKIIDYNKNAHRFFSVASEVDKGKSKTKPEESTAERVKLRRQKSKKKEFNNFLEQIKEEQIKNIYKPV